MISYHDFIFTYLLHVVWCVFVISSMRHLQHFVPRYPSSSRVLLGRAVAAAGDMGAQFGMRGAAVCKLSLMHVVLSVLACRDSVL